MCCDSDTAPCCVGISPSIQSLPSTIRWITRAAMRPQVSANSACQMAMHHWGFAGPLACVELAGYDDRNLRLKGQ